MSLAHVLIPAAGAARRMRGGDKLLEAVGGEPALARAVRIARQPGAGQVWVTLRPGDSGRRAVLEGSRARVLEIPGWEEGMAASLRAGAHAAGAKRASALLVLLPDMPDLGPEDIARFYAAHADAPDAAWRGASETGEPGHPVLFPARLFARLQALTGDRGAKAVLDEEGAAVRSIILPGRRATNDLDTPEAWAEWRAKSGA
jgi:CTP:molybdopterin cytidylyltransferase MocA